ncbi:MAG: hypothetical protein JKY15_07610 [Deltaproteobacteria bacterium]|nr:hypothetical protein [Deltaproteobacteria bacterium]
MVSPTQQTWNIRERKRKKAGSKRKAAMANHGTTVNKEELFKVVEADKPAK